jgi:hypothetical protein
MKDGESRFVKFSRWWMRKALPRTCLHSTTRNASVANTSVATSGKHDNTGVRETVSHENAYYAMDA